VRSTAASAPAVTHGGSAVSASDRWSAGVTGADQPGSGAATLQTLQEAQRRCTRCVDAGHLAASKPVFSGDAGQRILLVGQAPGPVENDCTRPFAGRAGRQLMRWFERGGFAGEADVRRRVYMTSMTTCFPGRTPDGRGDRRPSSREVALCSGWLEAVLGLLAPRLVMPIGSLALARFLPGHRLDDAVGRLFDASGAAVEAPGEVPAVLPLLLPLPHPSGQSRWLNAPARVRQLESALSRLAPLIRWSESG
jgi:uracil-DNA glycosylase